MKKVLAICVALILVMSMSVTAFAANGGFISSPTNSPAPEVESVVVGGSTGGSTGVTVELVVTPMASVGNLATEDKAEMDKAYNEIVENKDVTKLSTDLAEKVEDMGLKAEDVGVKDLFDLDLKTTGTATVTGKVSIKLKVGDIKNFVALMHMRNGVWEVVEGAAYANGVLSFEVDSFSPFAIVVEAKTGSSETGDNSALWLFAALAVASGAALVVCLAKGRKQAA